MRAKAVSVESTQGVGARARNVAPCILSYKCLATIVMPCKIFLLAWADAGMVSGFVFGRFLEARR